jgi:hypothetical protein
VSRRDEVELRAANGEPTVASMMAAFSQDAVSHAATLGKDLDYTEASLAEVEEILGVLERDSPKGMRRLFKKAPSQEEIETVCKMYGGYIGEVMRFEWGDGDWLIPEDGPFAGALVLNYGGSMTSPPAKVFTRLADGPGDDVYYYYQVLKQGREQK